MPRLLAPALVRPLALIAPALAVPAMAVALVAAPLPAAGQGLAGPYLAAEHAARHADVLGAARYYATAQSRDPANLALLERAVLHQVAAGRIGTAVAGARKLGDMRTGHHLATLVLSADALRHGDAEKVMLLFEQDAEADTSFVARVVKAWAAFGAGDRETAEAVLASLGDDETGGRAVEMIAAHHRGLMAVAAGDDEAAVAAFEQASEVAGGLPSRLYVRHHAGALARLGRTEEARALVLERLAGLIGDARLEGLAERLSDGDAPRPRVTTASQGAAEALFTLAGLLARDPMSPATVPIAYARLASWIDPELVEAKLLIAELLAEQEQYELAVEAFAAVPGDVPEALEAMLGRSRALEEAGETGDALDTLRLAVERFGDDLEAHTALGDLLRREERWREAADAYDAALAMVDGDEARFWPLFYQRGITYERSDEWDKAEADFRHALTLEPDQPLVLNYLGYSLVEMGEKLEEAEAMIEKAVEQRPDDGYIVDSLGWVRFRLGQFEDAVENLQTAVELRPIDPILNDHLGDALWMVGRRTEARFQWKRALSFDPEEEDAERIHRKLESGLDTVLAEEKAAGKPTIITREETRAASPNGG